MLQIKMISNNIIHKYMFGKMHPIDNGNRRQRNGYHSNTNEQDIFILCHIVIYARDAVLVTSK